MRTKLPFMDTLTKLQKIKGFYKNKELGANLFRIPPTEEKLRQGRRGRSNKISLFSSKRV